jgi:hypothetical protein
MTFFALVLMLATLSACGGGTADGPSLYVDAGDGSDENDGSQGKPFKTIQAALDVVEPGTTIRLAEGEYRGRIETKVDGKKDAPITIKGPEEGKNRDDRYRAVVTDKSRVVNIDHDYYVLDGFTVDGQPGLQADDYPTKLKQTDDAKRSLRDRVTNSRLIYVGSADDTSGVTGVTIRNMFLNGSGGECVRLRNKAHDNTITDSVIQYCGMAGSDGGFHNGEGVYIGTSPKSEDQPMPGSDEGHDNTISNNIIRTFGTECLDVKEAAHDNVFENNECSDNAETTDDGGSLVELRGHHNVVRDNRIFESLGYGVKIRVDGEQYDNSGNVVRSNQIDKTAGAPFFMRTSAKQGELCGNEFRGGKADIKGADADPTAGC